MAERTQSRGIDGEDAQDGSVPTGTTGVGVGAGEPSTFEPEEDAGGAAQHPAPEGQA